MKGSTGTSLFVWAKLGKYYNVEDGAWTDIQERHYLWKIPDSEFNYNKAMNQSTDQNPGYTSAE